MARLAEVLLDEHGSWGWAAGCIAKRGELLSVQEAYRLVRASDRRGWGISVVGETEREAAFVVVAKRMDPPAAQDYERFAKGDVLCFRTHGPVPWPTEDY